VQSPAGTQVRSSTWLSSPAAIPGRAVAAPQAPLLDSEPVTTALDPLDDCPGSFATSAAMTQLPAERQETKGVVPSTESPDGRLSAFAWPQVPSASSRVKNRPSELICGNKSPVTAQWPASGQETEVISFDRASSPGPRGLTEAMPGISCGFPQEWPDSLTLNGCCTAPY
jgi:hypothetical protein